ncbi:hypothetical protein [Tabrizicola sp.]|uniref:hypothetical protein n=1 Tax=Tabrizicola sp. TaxID=2005166 RepID=UPI0035B46879
MALAPLPPEQTTTAQFAGDFADRRAELAESIRRAPAADRPARQLDYAQFLLAHMLLPEARGVIDALPDGMTATDRNRAEGYLAILSRLAGGPPGTLPETWAEAPLWSVLVTASARDERELRAAVAGLDDQSRAVATVALPLVFDAAIDSDFPTVAAELLAAAPAETDLDGTSVLDLMRGRLALAQGAEDLAFDTFARVAEGRDRPAAQARIALADMALARQDSALLPEVETLLGDGLDRWKGDAAALGLRLRLAQVAEEMGDIPTAAEALAMILRDHPDTPEAAQAGTGLDGMSDRLRQSVADPDLPLPAAVQLVRRLDRALAGRSGWIATRLALAQRLADAGLLQAAKAEYAAIARDPTGADPAMLDALTVARAGLLLKIGDRDAARRVLDLRGYPRDPAQVTALAALRLQAEGTAMLPPPLLAALKVDDASDIPDAKVQLELAKVATKTGQTDAALAAYDRGLSSADQTERLVSSMTAAMAGDGDRAARYAAGLTGDRADLLRAAVTSLAAPRLAGKSLSILGATDLITAAAEAGQTVDALLAEAGP